MILNVATLIAFLYTARRLSMQDFEWWKLTRYYYNWFTFDISNSLLISRWQVRSLGNQNVKRDKNKKCQNKLQLRCSHIWINIPIVAKCETRVYWLSLIAVGVVYFNTLYIFYLRTSPESSRKTTLWEHTHFISINMDRFGKGTLILSNSHEVLNTLQILRCLVSIMCTIDDNESVLLNAAEIQG